MAGGMNLDSQYGLISQYLQEGPAWLKIDMVSGIEVEFLVSAVYQQQQEQDGTGLIFKGPNGNEAYVYKENIFHIQPEGPQDGTKLHITLDVGTELLLKRSKNIGEGAEIQ